MLSEPVPFFLSVDTGLWSAAAAELRVVSWTRVRWCRAVLREPERRRLLDEGSREPGIPKGGRGRDEAAREPATPTGAVA